MGDSRQGEPARSLGPRFLCGIDSSNKRIIIELAGKIPRLGRLPTPEAMRHSAFKSVGSTVRVDLTKDGLGVNDSHDVKPARWATSSSIYCFA